MKRLITIFLLVLIQHSLIAQEVKYEIFNTSINSKYAELGVTFLKENKVLFASSKKFQNKRGRHNRQLYLELYYGKIDENGDIQQSSKFSKEINNKYFESDVTFTPDFKTIFFTWNNFYDTQSRKDSAEFKPLYLFSASVDENFNISNILPLPFNSKNYSVRSPEVSKDGKKLYFTSDMPNGFGGFDIYEVTIINGRIIGWPKNLGPNVNTNKNELFPFIDNENTLYFASYGHKGKGRLDIFKSKNSNGIFQKAENLPAPINSKYDDFGFVIKPESNMGYFTSNRKYGKGDVDIYGFKLIEKETEKKVKKSNKFALECSTC